MALLELCIYWRGETAYGDQVLPAVCLSALARIQSLFSSSSCQYQVVMDVGFGTLCSAHGGKHYSTVLF